MHHGMCYCVRVKDGERLPRLFSVRSFLSLSTDTAGRQAFHLLRLPGLYAIIVRGVVTAYFWGDISYACVKRGVIQNETGVNWRKIKAEYIAGGISQHKIADKYGVPFGTLQKRARVEQWTAKRKAAEEKAVEKVSQKTAEIVADNATIAEQIKTKLLRRLSDMVDGFPATKAGEMRVREENTELIYRLKDLAAVYNSLTADMQKAGSVDVEDLAPLVELLKG